MTDERRDRKRKRKVSRTIRASCQSVTIFPRKINVEKSGGRRKHGREAKTWKGDTFCRDVACCSKISNQGKNPRIYRTYSPLLIGFVLFNFWPSRREKSRRDYFLFASSIPQLSPTTNKMFPRIDALQARSSSRR